MMSLQPNGHSARIAGKEVPRRPWLFAQRQSRGRLRPLGGPNLIDRTVSRRLSVRLWARLAKWTERQLCAAYDRLVDYESDWRS